MHVQAPEFTPPLSPLPYPFFFPYNPFSERYVLLHDCQPAACGGDVYDMYVSNKGDNYCCKIMISMVIVSLLLAWSHEDILAEALTFYLLLSSTTVTTLQLCAHTAVKLFRLQGMSTFICRCGFIRTCS